METIETINDGDSLHKGHFNRIGDLINIEGPMLSLFEDSSTKQLFLYDWVDSDQNVNRWLIYQSLPSDLFEYISKNISHLDLFNRSVRGAYYCADIDSRKQIGHYEICQLKNVSDVYFPTKGQFFDVEYSTDFEKIILLVSKAKATEQSDNSYHFGTSIMTLNLTDKGLSKEFGSDVEIEPSGITELNIDNRHGNSNWFSVAEVGPNTIYGEKIKTEEAHARQIYKLPRRETVEVPG